MALWRDSRAWISTVVTRGVQSLRARVPSQRLRKFGVVEALGGAAAPGWDRERQNECQWRPAECTQHRCGIKCLEECGRRAVAAPKRAEPERDTKVHHTDRNIAHVPTLSYKCCRAARCRALTIDRTSPSLSRPLLTATWMT